MQPLNPDQQELLAGILAGESMASIAERLGVGTSSLYRWKKLPYFQRALAEASRRTLDAAFEVLEAASAEMAQVVLDLAGDENTPPATRLSAAKVVLELCISARRELLESRLDELEQAIEDYRREWRDGRSA